MMREISTLIDQALGPLARRVGMMLAHAAVRLVTRNSYPTAQVELLDSEVIDDVPFRQDYGLASAPHDGAEGVFLSIGGVRAEGVVIAVADRRYRITLLQGEVALYDDLGQVVHLKRDQILVKSPAKVVVEAPDIRLGGANANRKVARVDDVVAGGKITTGSDVVRCL